MTTPKALNAGALFDKVKETNAWKKWQGLGFSRFHLRSVNVTVDFKRLLDDTELGIEDFKREMVSSGLPVRTEIHQDLLSDTKTSLLIQPK